MFFTYRQNNSGGVFDFDDRKGIGVAVIVEAASVAEANERAEAIGLYFDGCDSGIDCDCCGDRWSRPYGDGTKKPEIYSTDVSNGKYAGLVSWHPKGIEGYIHYLNKPTKVIMFEKMKKKG